MKLPNNYSSFDEILNCEAGKLFLAIQVIDLSNPVTIWDLFPEVEEVFKNKEKIYIVFSDNSVLFNNEVYPDLSDMLNQMNFGDQSYEELNSVDKNFLLWAFGSEEDVKEFIN
jgi:nucleoid-associated protein YejK